MLGAFTNAFGGRESSVTQSGRPKSSLPRGATIQKPLLCTSILSTGRQQHWGVRTWSFGASSLGILLKLFFFAEASKTEPQFGPCGYGLSSPTCGCWWRWCIIVHCGINWTWCRQSYRVASPIVHVKTYVDKFSIARRLRWQMKRICILTIPNILW